MEHGEKATDEVDIHRHPPSGDLILSQAPSDWVTIYAALDDAGFPGDYLADRAQGEPEVREEL